MNLTTETVRTDLQMELEAYSVQLGIARYREALKADGTGGVPAGQQLIKAAMGPMVEAIKQWLEVTGQGLASRSASLYHFVNQLDPEVTAWITAHAAISLLHERPPVPRVATSVAVNMEASC